MHQILWRDAKRQLGASGPHLTIAQKGPKNVETLLGQIKAKHIDATLVAQQKEPSPGVSAPRLTPGNETKWLVDSTPPIHPPG